VGLTEEAVKLYQAVLHDRQSAFREDAQIGLGWSYLAQDDPGAARRVFERYRLQHPLGRWTSEALRGLALAYERQGDRTGVIKSYRQWLRTVTAPAHPDRGDVLLGLAAALAEQGELSEAIRLYEEAERMDEAVDGRALIAHADLLVQLQRLDPAARLYQRGARATTDAAQAEWAMWQLARLRRMQKRYDDARSVLDDLAQRAGETVVGRAAVAMRQDLDELE
jgi:tetratricopeptide (TPR) repeat protein